MLAIIAAMTMLAIPIAIDEAHAEPQADVVHIEGRSYLFSAGIDGEVTWDFGDGTVVRSSEAVAHSFPSSGLWTVTVTDSSRTYDLQVMIKNMEKSTVIIEKNRLSRWEVVASRRFELRSQDPESRMIDHYTTRLSGSPNAVIF